MMHKRSVRWTLQWLVTLIVLFHVSSASLANTVIVGIDADLLSTNPAQSVRHPVSDLIYGFVFPSLFAPYPGPHGEYVPGLALSAERVSARRWEIQLAEDRHLLTGERVDAHLIVALFEQLIDAEVSAGLPAHDRFSAIEAVEVIDEYRFGIDLKRTQNSLPTLLAREWLMPSQGMAGPYRFDRWDRGNRVILVAVDEKATPHYRMQFEVYTSVAQRLNALRNNQIQVAMNLPAERLPDLLAEEAIQVKAVPGTRTFFLEFNTQRPPFNDPRVRLAVALALDIPSALQEAHGGVGLVTGTLLSPATFGRAPDLAPYEYDPERARQLLIEAGYPHGFEIELDYLPYRAELAMRYAEMLEAVGIGVHLREWPNWSTLRSALQQGDRMMWTSEWDNSSQDPGGILPAKLATGGSANYGGYSNPDVDVLLAAADQASDMAWRIELLHQVQLLLWHDVAIVPEYVEEEIFAVRVEYQDWEIPYRPSRLISPPPTEGIGEANGVPHGDS